MIERAISIIKNERVVSSSVLSVRLGVSKNEATRLLKILEEQGILRKLGIELMSTTQSHCSLEAEKSACSRCDAKGCIMKCLFS